MSFREAMIRRIIFWTAMLTGAVLVGSQFGCVRPQMLFSAPGLPPDR